MWAGWNGRQPCSPLYHQLTLSRVEWILVLTHLPPEYPVCQMPLSPTHSPSQISLPRWFQILGAKHEDWTHFFWWPSLIFMSREPSLNLHSLSEPALHSPAVLPDHPSSPEEGQLYLSPKGYFRETQCSKKSEVTVIESRKPKNPS